MTSHLSVKANGVRIVVDALAATERGGGVGTYVRCLLGAWREVAPEDHLTVVVTSPFGELISADPRCAMHRLVDYPARQPRVGWRVLRSEVLVPRLQSGADVLLSTITSLPLAWRKPAVAVVYDLRHEERPSDFALSQRALRAWQFSAAYRRSAMLVAISERTGLALRSRHPQTASRVAMAHLGADHVLRRTSTRDGDVLAFGHYENKEAALLLRVWQIALRSQRGSARRLRIVGLGEAQQRTLAREVTRLGLSANTVLDAFVPAEQFAALMGAAAALLLPSRYEGFGLGVVEAMRQGVPVMISPDPALREVAAGHASASSSWNPEDLADAVQRALGMSSPEIEAAQRHSDRFTWRRTVELTRASVEAAIRA